MVDNFLTFFVAGQETTANTLAFAILELGRNPDVLKKYLKIDFYAQLKFI